MPNTNPKKPNENPIQTAQLEWREDDAGNTVPVSKQFGDVYFSLVDGLAESRYVFLEHNNLPNRLAKLTECTSSHTFCIGELGFGTGLNFFATWQLWQQVKQQASPKNNAKLHFISFEKFPLTKTDLAKALTSWADKEPQIAPLIEKLIKAYPTLIEGCHRLNFYEDNLTLDLWLGDATDNMAKIHKSNLNGIDAWYLDGFAPSCNESLWADKIFSQINRLSSPQATASTFSCAGVVKRGFKNIGFDITKVKGFGRKREMLTAKQVAEQSTNNSIETDKDTENQTKTAIVVGAGVSGLMSAWALANRGVQVTILDKTAPLAGASGNPRGLLAPKMTPIHHVANHLHSIGYLYSARFYKQCNISNQNTVLETTSIIDMLTKANVNAEQINTYPTDFAQVLPKNEAQTKTGLTKQDLTLNQYLPQGGLINPQALSAHVLSHPLVYFKQAEAVSVTETADLVTTHCKDMDIQADDVVICTADKACKIDDRIFDFRKIRGQISWFVPTDEQLKKLPKLPLKYGGYCASFTPVKGDAKHNNVKIDTPCFMLGASFIRNDLNSSIREEEHNINQEKLLNAIPEMATVITDTKNWQARVGIRSQTPDYHPLVGLVGNSKRIWTLSGMGAKGYAYAPICSEALADLMAGTIPPLSTEMIAKLSPNRERLLMPLNQKA